MVGAELAQSLSKARFCRALQKLVPDVRPGDLEAGGAGVRAQAMTVSGELVQDFHLVTRDNALHVLNAPSPARQRRSPSGGISRACCPGMRLAPALAMHLQAVGDGRGRPRPQSPGPREPPRRGRGRPRSVVVWVVGVTDNLGMHRRVGRRRFQA